VLYATHDGHQAGQMKRQYQATHPWLTFDLDLRPAPSSLWLKLGEAQSKCEHLAGYPLKPEYARRLHMVYLAKGVLATTAIEGNTLSEEEVSAHLEGKLQLPPSRAYLTQEIDNIVELYNGLLTSMAAVGDNNIRPDLVKEFNKTVLRNLPVDEHTTPGDIRKDSRVVGRYRCPPPEDCDFLLGELCDWLNSDKLGLQDGNEIVCGIIRAIVAHTYLVWIHPFGDGNGRTARAVEVKILLDAGVPSDACQLLSNYYNKTRPEYYRQLDAASKQHSNILPFIEYAVTGLVEELKEQIDSIRNMNLDITWVNYIHDQFRDKKSPPERRRRALALAISEHEFVQLASIKKLTPDLAAEYSQKAERTVLRDVSHLIAMGLVERVGTRSVRAKKEVISAFLPTRKHLNNS